MSRKVIMIPITKLKRYREGKLDLRPESNDFKAQLYYEDGYVFLYQEAKKAAKDEDSICVAVFSNGEEAYVFSTGFSKGDSASMILFNSQEASAADGEVETYISGIEESRKWIKYYQETFD